MDKEITKDLFEVENPVYQSYDNVVKKYLGYTVVITNMEPSERGSGDLFKRAIVRYYTMASKKEYLGKWIECTNVPEYGKVMFMNLTPNPGSLGGLYLG
jgi:hypothetical protein